MARYPYDQAHDPDQIHGEIAALNLPGFLGIAGGAIGSTVFTADFDGELTPADKATLDAAIAGHAPQSAIVKLRNQAKELLDAIDDERAMFRASMVAIAKRFEIIHLNIWNAFKAQVAAASSLADLKTRVASLPSLPNLSKANILQAIRDEITDGTGDTST
jgi:hypothetical protein